MKKPLGVILYQGPSMLDPLTEVALVATFESNNKKTGNIIQSWIIETGRKPSTANHSTATCGNCPIKKVCYVNFRSTNSVHKAFMRGSYPVYDASIHKPLFYNRKHRKGSDGDPNAIPPKIWIMLERLTGKGVGYTHQWREHDQLLGHVMASVESVDDKIIANAKGYKTFRIVSDYSEKLNDEIICLYDSRGKQCVDCMLCNGNTLNVVIKAHGSKKSNFNMVTV